MFHKGLDFELNMNSLIPFNSTLSVLVLCHGELDQILFNPRLQETLLSILLQPKHQNSSPILFLLGPPLYLWFYFSCMISSWWLMSISPMEPEETAFCDLRSLLLSLGKLCWVPPNFYFQVSIHDCLQPSCQLKLLQTFAGLHLPSVLFFNQIKVRFFEEVFSRKWI